MHILRCCSEPQQGDPPSAAALFCFLVVRTRDPSGPVYGERALRVSGDGELGEPLRRRPVYTSDTAIWTLSARRPRPPPEGVTDSSHTPPSSKSGKRSLQTRVTSVLRMTRLGTFSLFFLPLLHSLSLSFSSPALWKRARLETIGIL